MGEYKNTRKTFDRNYYKSKLVSIYESATGRRVDRTSLSDIHAVVEYFYQLDARKHEYKSFLRTLGIDYDRPTAIEAGVGPIDSLFLKNQTTIVSPYYGLVQRENGKTYAGDYMVQDGDLVMINRSPRKFEIDTSPLEIGNGRLYITNNIMHPINLNTWFKIAKKNEVVLGAYGFKTDLDKEKKINVLKAFERELEDSEYERGTSQACYYEIVHSKPRR